MAQTYDFSSSGLKSFQNPATIATIAQAYATTQWETSEDNVTPGLANALSFKSQASSITSVDQILGNPTMRTVVTVALGIPEQIAFQDMWAQEQAISTRVDIRKFQNPTFVANFTQRYLLNNAASSSSSSSSSSDLTTLASQGGGMYV